MPPDPRATTAVSPRPMHGPRRGVARWRSAGVALVSALLLLLVGAFLGPGPHVSHGQTDRGPAPDSAGATSFPGLSSPEDTARPDRLRSEDGELEVWFYPCQYRPPSALIPFLRPYVGNNNDIRADTQGNRIIIRSAVDRMALFGRILRLLDRPPRQVRCEIKIISFTYTNDVQLGASSTMNLDDKTAGNQELFFRGYSLSFLPEDYLAALQANPGNPDAAQDDFTGTSVFFDALGETQSRLGSLDIAIRTLQANNRAIITAQPIVTVEQGYPATIEAGQEVPISIRESVQNGVPFVKTTYESVGNSVRILAEEIGDDTVRLDIRPTTSRISRFFDSGSGVSNPIIQNTSASTTVTLRSEETLELGGLQFQRQLRQETGVPLLMDIPILGYLFRATNREYQRRDVVFFITPTIVPRLNDAASSRLSRQTLDLAELAGGSGSLSSSDDDSSSE